MLKTILNTVKGRQREGSKTGLLITAATTGVTIARYFGKRSIYGVIGGIGVTLAADYIQKKYKKNIEPTVSDKPALDKK